MAVTPNLGLHQWQAGDAFLRTEFNGDFSKIDGAVGERAQCATAAYTGDGKDGRTFSLGFRPKAVWLFGYSGERTCTGTVTEGRAFRSINRSSGMGEGEVLEVAGNTRYAGMTDGGFVLYSYDFYNVSTRKYFYVAIG